jgi:predicted SprT family Zn-dependent metalloprotease
MEGPVLAHAGSPVTDVVNDAEIGVGIAPGQASKINAVVMYTATEPTQRAYGELLGAAEYFNRELFGGQLPPCLITLRAGKKAHGFFAPSRFIAGNGDRSDEIALNPTHFGDTGELLQTLAHELVHLWQHHFGTPSRSGYHNQEWAGKMLSIGLVPSDTGAPGGKQTGQRMADYPARGGLFINARDALIAGGFKVTWTEAAITKPNRFGTAGRRTKFTCRHCGENVWARPSSRPVCGICHPDVEPMEAEPEHAADAAANEARPTNRGRVTGAA